VTYRAKYHLNVGSNKEGAPMSGWTKGFSMVALAVLASSASGTSPVYHCTKDGQTVLTDKPCDASNPAPASGAITVPSSGAVGTQASGTSCVAGDWRGQTQFQGAQNGIEIEEAHTVVPLVLTFSPDGKVSGTSADNGCTLLGLWAPELIPRRFTLDVTLKGCHFAGLNRRYSGELTAALSENSAQLSLVAFTGPIPGQPLMRYDIGATLRR
jgi:hypothetical protein